MQIDLTRQRYLHALAAKMKLVVALAAILVALPSLAPIWAAPTYDIVSLGFDDIEHTSSSGSRSSRVRDLNEMGHVIGSSTRYNGGSASLGASIWLYDGTTTIKMGLTDAEHAQSYYVAPRDGAVRNIPDNLNDAGHVVGSTRRIDGGYSAWLYNGTTTANIGLIDPVHTGSNGHRDSNPLQLNGKGDVLGYARQYIDNSQAGFSAWLYDGTTTVNIGLTDAEHTSSTGWQISDPDHMNESGQAIGYSFRYNAEGVGAGRSAWLYDGSTTIRIGLTGAEHARTDGYQDSQPALSFSPAFPLPRRPLGRLNEAGQTIGISLRYREEGLNPSGQSAWLYDSANTIHIGLIGDEHTHAGGLKISESIQLNEAAQVIGISRRYSGSASAGQSTWLYDGENTIDIGLTGAEHTRDDGYRYSIPIVGQLNEAGQVIGYSNRYSPEGSGMGGSAWLYDGTQTIDIGLTGAEHTRDDGFEASSPSLLNEAGRVLGHSSRYNGGGSELGRSAWLYDGHKTIDIGLTGAEYTRDDGYKDSAAQRMNEAGQITGVAYRYNGGSTQLGQDAWFYDPALDQAFPLQLSTRSDGFAYSSVHYLDENGVALGSYTLFDELDNELGDRPFYFSVAGGLHDLGSLVDGGLAVHGWEYLASTIRANSAGQIIGSGERTSGGSMAFLLTPVPEGSGDFNHDGVVDAADYTIWRDGLGTVFTLDDYGVWKTHFGQSIGNGAALASAERPSAALPEPAASVMLLAAMLLATLPHRLLPARVPWRNQ